MDPLRIVSLESRRATEMARLLERHGLAPIIAPSMQEVPLEDQHEALEHAEQLVNGEFDVIVLLTGVGFSMLCDVLSTRYPRETFVSVLAARTRICRGPKPVAVLKTMGLSPDLVAPEPNTWRELLAAIDARGLSLDGKRVIVQEYGIRNQALIEGLGSRGAHVQPVPLYAWRLPEDTGPLERAIHATWNGETDGVLFTSQQQVQHLFEVAKASHAEDALTRALRRRVLVASIGPITSEALQARGIGVDLEPEHPKMGHLVRVIAERGRRELREKRAAASRG